MTRKTQILLLSGALGALVVVSAGAAAGAWFVYQKSQVRTECRVDTPLPGRTLTALVWNLEGGALEPGLLASRQPDIVMLQGLAPEVALTTPCVARGDGWAIGAQTQIQEGRWLGEGAVTASLPVEGGQSLTVSVGDELDPGAPWIAGLFAGVGPDDPTIRQHLADHGHPVPARFYDETPGPWRTTAEGTEDYVFYGQIELVSYAVLEADTPHRPLWIRFRVTPP